MFVKLRTVRDARRGQKSAAPAFALFPPLSQSFVLSKIPSYPFFGKTKEGTDVVLKNHSGELRKRKRRRRKA